MNAVAIKFSRNADSAYHRTKMAEFANYYMVVRRSPDKLQLQLQLVREWNRPYSTISRKAQEANSGHPTEARR